MTEHFISFNYITSYNYEFQYNNNNNKKLFQWAPNLQYIFYMQVGTHFFNVQKTVFRSY